MIVLQLSSHSTHFLQSLDVVIFQQWKHWHTEKIDHHIRQDIDEFNHQTFLANLESIRQLILTPGNIKSVFHCCGYVPFRPQQIMRMMPDEPSPEPGPEPELENEDEDDLPMQWELPRTHGETQLQAKAIQNMLCSSLSSPNTPPRCQNCENV